MSILDELYTSGCIHIPEPATEEFKQAKRSSERLYLDLSEQLSPALYRELEDFLATEATLHTLQMTETFLQSVKLGARLYQELIGPDKIWLL